MTARVLTNKFFLFILFAAAGGVLGAFLKYEVLWDYLNYHYYNGFSFLNDRSADIAPASLLTYFNPVLDAATYALSNVSDDRPTLYHFITGLPFGILMYQVFLISKQFVSGYKNALVLLIAATGVATFSQIGTSSHEITLAVCVSGAFYLLEQSVFIQKSAASKPFFFAGVLLGATAGLKFTAGLYCVSTALCLLIFYQSLQNPKKQLFWFAVGGIVGFLITNGFWAVTLYQKYGNPFFPLFNGFFKSPWFLPVTYKETLYLENRTFLQTLFLPVILLFHFKENFVGALSFSDAHFLFGITALLIGAVKCYKEKTNGGYAFLLLWTGASYVLWLMLSGVIRYTVAFEVLFAVIIVKTLFSFKKPSSFLGESLTSSLMTFVLFVLVSTPFFLTPWATRQGGDFVVEFDMPKVPENTLVLLYGHPTSAFLAQIARQTPSVTGIGFTHTNKGAINRHWDFADKTLFNEKRNTVLRAHRGAKIAFIENKAFYLTFPSPETAAMNCKKIRRKRRDETARVQYLPDVFMCWSEELNTTIPNGTPFAEFVRTLND